MHITLDIKTTTQVQAQSEKKTLKKLNKDMLDKVKRSNQHQVKNSGSPKTM